MNFKACLKLPSIVRKPSLWSSSNYLIRSIIRLFHKVPSFTIENYKFNLRLKEVFQLSVHFIFGNLCGCIGLPSLFLVVCLSEMNANSFSKSCNFPRHPCFFTMIILVGQKVSLSGGTYKLDFLLHS